MRAIERPPDTADLESRSSDLELMRASLARPDRFAEIFDRHSAAVHRYLSRRVDELADDLLSETFLTAFHKRGAYRAERLDVRPWLYGIAANLIRRHHRAEAARYRAIARSTADVDVAWAGRFTDAEDRADAQAIRQRLAAALAELKADDREVLLLVAWGDLSQSEVAEALDLAPGTVRSRLHRARTRVREHLAQGQPAATATVLRFPENA